MLIKIQINIHHRKKNQDESFCKVFMPLSGWLDFCSSYWVQLGNIANHFVLGFFTILIMHCLYLNATLMLI